jgi:hypothetical protein
MPFFFLLVDSVFESLLVFSGAASAVPLLPVVADWVVTRDGASVPGGALPVDSDGWADAVTAAALPPPDGAASVRTLVEFTLPGAVDGVGVVGDVVVTDEAVALPPPAVGPTEMISAPTLVSAADAEPEVTDDTASTGPESPALLAAF